MDKGCLSEFFYPLSSIRVILSGSNGSEIVLILESLFLGVSLSCEEGFPIIDIE